MELATWISLASLGLSGWALYYASTASRASNLQAKIAADADRRARQPQLTFRITGRVQDGDWRAWIEVTNEGPADLDAIEVHQPVTVDGVNYPVAAMGGDDGPIASLGPVPRLGRAEFSLCVGPTKRPPRFVIRLVSRAGDESWDHDFEVPRSRIMPQRIIYAGGQN